MCVCVCVVGSVCGASDEAGGEAEGADRSVRCADACADQRQTSSQRRLSRGQELTPFHLVIIYTSVLLTSLWIMIGYTTLNATRHGILFVHLFF